MKVPERLFKYTSIDVYSLINLKNNQLYYSFPSTFNDPYDCNLPIVAKDKSFSTYKKHRKENLPECELSTDDYQQLIEEETIASLRKFQDESRHNMGVCCFSQNQNNPLMWSHYAFKHQGMCLEFDTNYEFPKELDSLFLKIRPVKYVSSVPAKDILNYFDSKIDDNFVIEMFCSKSTDWEYEEEWRSFFKVGGKCYGYPAKALTAIYFGMYVETELVNLVRHIRPDIKFYIGRKSETDFEILFDLME